MRNVVRRLTAGAVTTTLACLGMAVAAPAAEADSGLGKPRGTLYSGCHDYPVTLRLEHPGAASWSVEMSAYTPTGEYSTGFYDYGPGSSATEEEALFLCGHEGAGEWTLDGSVTYYDAANEELATEQVSVTMPMRRMGTRTSLRVSDRTPLRGEVIGLRVTSRTHQRAGWRANRDDAVVIYARCGAEAWHLVPAKRLTNAVGTLRARVRYDAPTPCRVRARTVPAVDARGSWSPVVRMRPGSIDRATGQATDPLAALSTPPPGLSGTP